MLSCFCGQVYADAVDLEEHRIARGHFPSHRCSATCNHPKYHSDSLEIARCGYCSKTCSRLDILYDHQIATGHCYCADCNQHFENKTALDTHRASDLHASEFKCCDCDITFKDVHALTAHMARPVHQILPTVIVSASVTSTVHACKKCSKTFGSAQALQQHSKSVKHKPLSALSCPMVSECQKRFASPSALLHHLESGGCRSGMSREDIHALVQAFDEDGVVHDRAALSSPQVSPSIPSTPGSAPSITLDDWAVESDTESEWSLLTPSSTENITLEVLEQWSLLESSQTIPSSTTTPSGLQVSKLRCPFCPTTKRPFATSLALQQHMASPTHSARLYHCPRALFTNGKEPQKQEKYFATMSGLAQHLESGACTGGKATYKCCISIVQGCLERCGLGGAKLLLEGV